MKMYGNYTFYYPLTQISQSFLNIIIHTCIYENHFSSHHFSIFIMKFFQYVALYYIHISNIFCFTQGSLCMYGSVRMQRILLLNVCVSGVTVTGDILITLKASRYKVMNVNFCLTPTTTMNTTTVTITTTTTSI